MTTQKIEIFPSYKNSNLTDLHTYKHCDDDEMCLQYMFKNGDGIYKETDIYNDIPKQVQNEKLNSVFATNNIVREHLLNDEYIGELRRNYNVEDDFIINSILMHLRPVLFNNQSINDTDINTIKNKVSNTINFELYYMNTIENQLNMLLSNQTIIHIKKKVKEGVNSDVEIKDEYVNKILSHEINNYRSRYDRNANKISTDNVGNIYTNQMSRLRSRDIFNIINDTIARIVSDIMIENNMIKNNNKLDKWNTILGDNNKHGLRSYSNIKLNEKKPPSMLFNMTF
jgi:hypothetical protein